MSMGKNIKQSSARTDGKGQMGYCLRVALAQSLKVATSFDSMRWKRLCMHDGKAAPRSSG